MRKRSASRTSGWSSATRMHGVRVSEDLMGCSVVPSPNSSRTCDDNCYLPVQQAVTTTLAPLQVSDNGTSGTAHRLFVACQCFVAAYSLYISATRPVWASPG